MRTRFLSPAISAFALFSVLGFYSALIPSLLNQVFHKLNHALAGAIVAELFILGAIVVGSTRRAAPRPGPVVALSLLLPLLSHPKFLRGPAGNTKNKTLPIIKPFSHFKVFVGDTSRNRFCRTPIGITSVDGYLQIVSERSGCFCPV